jgi:hypothetical protein
MEWYTVLFSIYDLSFSIRFVVGDVREPKAREKKQTLLALEEIYQTLFLCNPSLRANVPFLGTCQGRNYYDNNVMC